MIPQIEMSQATQHIKDCFAAKVTPFLIGDTGVGKTDLFRQVANQLNFKLITIYLDSMYEMDVIGYAVPNKETGKFEYLPCELFPLESDALPINEETGKPYKGFLCLFDEFGNCPASMQTAAQRVLLEGSIGSHKLHPKCYIGLAGNKLSSGANAVPISAAVRDRCGIVEVDSSTQSYIDQALNHYSKIGLHPSVRGFVNYKPNVLLDSQQDLKNDGESPFPTSRSLEFVSNLLWKLQTVSNKQGTPLVSLINTRLYTIQSVLGCEYGTEFVEYVTQNLPTLHEIIASPTTAQLPNDLQGLMRVGAHIASNAHDANQAKGLVTYLKRMPDEAAKAVITDMVIAGKPIIMSKELEQYVLTLI